VTCWLKRNRLGLVGFLCSCALCLTACGSPATPTPGVVPIQSAVAADATRRTGPSGTATQLAIMTNQAQPGTAMITPMAGAGDALATDASNPSLTPGQSGQGDPCSLITNAEIQTIIGSQVQQPQRTTGQNGEAICQFRGAGTNPPMITLTLYQGSAEFNASRALSGASGVTGVGDEAVFVNGMLFVRSNSRHFSVSGAPANQPWANETTFRTIALLVLQRLSGTS